MGTVLLYLSAVVAANLLATWGGIEITPYVAFALIPFTLTTRDMLHARWQNRGALYLRMGLLIASGSVVSVLLNAGALNIAVASGAAFVAAGIVDTAVYVLMRRRSVFARMATSNAVSAAFDTVVFLVIAFGLPLAGSIVLSNWLVKVVGGVLWAWLLSKTRLARDRVIV